MNDPLEQFHKWYDRIDRLNDLTRYSLAREAFFAGHRTRPAEPRLPSRLALEEERGRMRLSDYDYREHGPSPETMERVQESLRDNEVTPRLVPLGHAVGVAYVPEETMMFSRDRQPVTDAPYNDAEAFGAEPDFIQHGTITGRISDDSVDVGRDFGPPYDDAGVRFAAEDIHPGPAGDYAEDHYGPPGPVPTPVDPADG